MGRLQCTMADHARCSATASSCCSAEEVEPSDVEMPSLGQAGGFWTDSPAVAVQFWQDYGSSGAAQQGDILPAVSREVGSSAVHS